MADYKKLMKDTELLLIDAGMAERYCPSDMLDMSFEPG